MTEIPVIDRSELNQTEPEHVYVSWQGRQVMKMVWRGGDGVITNYRSIRPLPLTTDLVHALGVAHRLWGRSNFGIQQVSNARHAFNRPSYETYALFARLVAWGLVERPRNEDGTVNNGMYHVTDLGVRFIEGGATVHRSVWKQGKNGRRIDWDHSSDQVTYSQIMAEGSKSPHPHDDQGDPA